MLSMNLCGEKAQIGAACIKQKILRRRRIWLVVYHSNSGLQAYVPGASVIQRMQNWILKREISPLLF